MKVTGVLCVTALLFTGSSSSFADQRAPVAVRVLNLGTQAITAFSLMGLPFRNVGLDARPGDMLTPAFGDGQMDYELYWRLQDGSVHGASIDLHSELPSNFYGYVFISLHDDHAAVSWSNLNLSWVEYRKIGNPKAVPRPSVPLYAGCSGAVLESPLAQQAWRETAERLRQRVPAERLEDELARGRCTLEWYIPQPKGRQRKSIDEETTLRLQQEWFAEIEKFKSEVRQQP